MDGVFFCATADDVGMAGYSTPAHLERLLSFWESEALKGTLFVVPRCEGREIGASSQYVALLKAASQHGHEIAQHGLDHGRFQTGIPPKMVLDLAHEAPARQYLDEHRAEIESSLTVQNLRKTLATGRRILETALGISISGFRAPCLSTCDALFEALHREAYTYDSSLVLQPAAWSLIADPDTTVAPAPITRDRLPPQTQPIGTREWPISAEYTWYLRRRQFDAFLNLARHDFDACMDAGIPFIPLCHISPVQEGDPDCGFDLYRTLLDHARERCDAEGRPSICATLSELSKSRSSA